MQYVLLIYQSTTPLPGSEEWANLPEDQQQATYADYQALNETPGVSPACLSGCPTTPPPCG